MTLSCDVEYLPFILYLHVSFDEELKQTDTCLMISSDLTDDSCTVNVMLKDLSDISQPSLCDQT